MKGLISGNFPEKGVLKKCSISMKIKTGKTDTAMFKDLDSKNNSC